MEEETKLIINILDIPTLLKIKRQCEIYSTYTIDFKQFNDKFGIKTNQKRFGDMLEYVNQILVFKQFEQKNNESDGKKAENIKSTMDEEQKKKTKKGASEK